ncbi:MAG: class I SAM-dependent methyltransferase [Pseudomonadota bacterium]
MTSRDASGGYNAIATEFMAARSDSGSTVVRNWAATLPHGSKVLDIGAGSGVPLTAILIDTGMAVFAIDAAPALVSAFRKRFPGVDIACDHALTSPMLDRRFDAILSVGLVFLLSESDQRTLIGRMARALSPNGRLLMSAPKQAGTWTDLLTDRPSLSLGEDAYRTLFAANDMTLADMFTDAGGSNYYSLRKSSASLESSSPA